MTNTYTNGVPHHIRQIILEGIDNGCGISQISAIIGQSRDRTRTQLKKLGLYPIPKQDPLTEATVAEFVRDFLQGRTNLPTWAKSLNMAECTLRKRLREEFEVDCLKLRKQRTQMLWNNRIYGDWTTVANTYERRGTTTWVTCRCVCGKVKDVNTSNLLSGSSKGCGCVGFHKITTGKTAEQFTWVSENACQMKASTLELAAATGVVPSTLYLRGRRLKIFRDSSGNVWVPHVYCNL